MINQTHPTVASVRSTLQVALLGNITSNIRGIRANRSHNKIDILFYYDKDPSEDEEELSEDVLTEVFSSYSDVLVYVHRFTIPEPELIPGKNEDTWIYFRWEPYI